MFKLQSRLYLRFEWYLYESITNKTQVQYHHLYDDKKAFFSIYGNIEKIKPYRSLKLLYFQISQMFPSWPRKCNKMSLQKKWLAITAIKYPSVAWTRLPFKVWYYLNWKKTQMSTLSKRIFILSSYKQKVIATIYIFDIHLNRE